MAIDLGRGLALGCQHPAHLLPVEGIYANSITFEGNKGYIKYKLVLLEISRHLKVSQQHPTHRHRAKIDLILPHIVALADKRKPLQQSLQPNQETTAGHLDTPSSDGAAAQFVKALQTTELDDPSLHECLNTIVSTAGWTEGLAKAILNGIHEVVKNGEEMTDTMTEASKKALTAVDKFANEYPQHMALVAGGTLVGLGVLAFMSPVWMMRALRSVVQGTTIDE